MENAISLERFVTAQQDKYDIAFSEIKAGRKRSHWMWYIFPQLQGLGLSEMSKLYAIRDLEEASAYLQHPVLGKRLLAICNELLQQPGNDAHAIFGSPDHVKLKSSLTLFAAVSNTDPVFESLIEKFFKGSKDIKTLQILHKA